jgi:hypothetical protein
MCLTSVRFRRRDGTYRWEREPVRRDKRRASRGFKDRTTGVSGVRMPEVGGCRIDHLWRYIEMLFQQTESNA